VTATEISIRFRRPQRDIFGLMPSALSNDLRFRIYPESQVQIDLIGKKQGAGWNPQQESLTFAELPASDMRPYDRLVGAALSGERFLFARQETVEAAWRVVDPVLGNAVPLHSYARGSWGPKEADGLLPEGIPWHDPVA
jgi:glucose-6-phosphate 1-dehydrogenase